MITGSCAMAKTTVSGINPNTLKLTQASVGMVRQTISFRPARTRKKKAQRHVRTRQPSSVRSEEQTSELQSLMRLSYAVFCLKKKIGSKNEVDTTATAHT